MKRPTIALAIFLAATAVPVSAQPRAVQVETQWVFDSDAAHARSTLHAAFQVKIQESFHVNSNAPLEEFLIPTILTVTPPEGFTVLEVVYPDPIMIRPSFAEVDMAVFEQEFVIGVALEVGPDVQPGMYVISGTLDYQACDDTSCRAPTDRELQSTLQVVPKSVPIAKVQSSLFDGIVFLGAGEPAVDLLPTPPLPNGTAPDADCDIIAALEGFTVLAAGGGYRNSTDFIEFIDQAETGTFKANVLEGKGPLVIVLLVILGGIALNLTPCVLPLIPINIAIIGAGARAGSRARGFALGGTYGLAMAIVYGVLGLVVILTATTFGAINNEIWFNVGIGILFVVLGLAMFDVIHIDFSKLQSKFDVSGAAGKGSFALAFGMGVIAALLAGACVAPVVIQVIVYAGDQFANRGNTTALALPFFLGLGMALPWPFAGAGLSILPKPGRWMVRVKYAFGVFILGFAAYYGHQAWGIYDSRRVDAGAVRSAVQERLEGGWTASVCDGLATARAQNKLVLIDMWATWCKACLAMDKKTLKDEAVEARLQDYVKIKFQAQFPEKPPASDVLDRFELPWGLPAYAILRPVADLASSADMASSQPPEN
ncbi:MAG: thioredoxin family protein [Planctomycetes bacterium]|nr:thioredoxin family protein [Planctomycetota bacterium]